MTTRALPHGERVEARRDAGHSKRPKLTERPWWPWAKRICTLVFFALVAALLWRYARTVEWDDVLSSIKETPRPTLLMAIAALSTSSDERRASRATRESTLAMYAGEAGLRQPDT